MAKEVTIKTFESTNVCSGEKHLEVECYFRMPYDALISRDDVILEFVKSLKDDCRQSLMAEIKYSVD